MEGVSREQVKDYIKNMTLMDAATLVKELEEELGVSAAAPVAVAAAAGPAAAAAEEKTEFNVILERLPHMKFPHIIQMAESCCNTRRAESPFFYPPLLSGALVPFFSLSPSLRGEIT